MRISTRATRSPAAAIQTAIDDAARGAASAGATHAVIQPVILAGGAGTRLWPLSREQFPKQLLNLVAEDSLLEATARRLDGLVKAGLVSRERSAADGRVMLGVLTPKGYEKLRAVAPQHLESVREHFIDRLTPRQIASIGEIFETLRDCADDSADDA